MMKEMTMNYETIKGALFLKAVAMERIPAGTPFRIIAGDMAAVCGIEIERSRNGVRSATITEPMLKALGVSREQLFRDARENAPKNRPAVLMNMGSAIGQLTGEEIPMEESPLMVAGVQGNVLGAAVICYPGFLKRVFEKVGNFYVLPSSVHEVLILPDDGEPKARGLNEMIRTINENEVLPQDRLSDIAYHFDGKRLETAQEYEDRRE